VQYAYDSQNNRIFSTPYASGTQFLRLSRVATDLGSKRLGFNTNPSNGSETATVPDRLGSYDSYYPWGECPEQHLDDGSAEELNPDLLGRNPALAHVARSGVLVIRRVQLRQIVNASRASAGIHAVGGRRPAAARLSDRNRGLRRRAGETVGLRTAASPVFALRRGGIPLQRVGRANGPRDQVAAAVRASATENFVSATAAEGAFERADHGPVRSRRQIAIAALAIWSKLKH
jgi:hypothetical protein